MFITSASKQLTPSGLACKLYEGKNGILSHSPVSPVQSTHLENNLLNE